MAEERKEEWRLTNEQHENLIKLYHNEADLWNVSSSAYSKKECRQRALLNMMPEFEGLVCTGM